QGPLPQRRCHAGHGTGTDSWSSLLGLLRNRWATPFVPVFVPAHALNGEKFIRLIAFRKQDGRAGSRGGARHGGVILLDLVVRPLSSGLQPVDFLASELCGLLVRWEFLDCFIRRSNFLTL